MTETAETWKPVVGFEDVYSVSDMGRVRRELTRSIGRAGNILKPTVESAGYPMVRLFDLSRKRHVSVHKLVMEAFVGPAAAGIEVNHINGVKTDSRLANLEYCTKSQNRYHAYAMGLCAVGEKHHKSKFTAESIAEARRLWKAGVAIRELARRYKVAKSSMAAAVKGRTWKSVA